MNFTNLLGLFAPIVLHFLEAITKKLMKEQETEKEYGIITCIMIPVCWGYCFAKAKITDNPVFAVLCWIQKHWWVAAIYILVMAVLPPAVAQKERKKKKFRASESYARQNLMYNVMGAAAAGAVFGLLCEAIGDLDNLKHFYVDDLIPVFACVSVWIAIVYQQMEQKKDRKKELDHDPSLKSMNQKLNLLHLFNVYLVSIISVVYLVVYTIYCQMNHINVMVRPDRACFFISLALIFFYVLLLHEHQYLYVTSIICIPVILISSVYWMSWFTLDREMRFWQWIFVLGHSVIYMLLLFAREKVICVRQCKDDDDAKHKQIRFGKWEIVLKNFFPLVLLVIVSAIYTLIWVIPSFVDRMPADEAYNYIDMICEGTDVDADEVIKRSWEQEMYYEEKDSYDIEAFMRFLTRELGEELLDKGIITEEGDIPSREDLSDRRNKSPRPVNK